MQYSGRPEHKGDQSRRSHGQHRWTAAWLALAGIGLLLSACNTGPQRTPAPTAVLPASGAASAPTSTPAMGAGGIPNFSHVFIIMFENKEYSTILGNPRAPYFNALAKQYALATQYYGIRHPIMPTSWMKDRVHHHRSCRIEARCSSHPNGCDDSLPGAT